MAYDYNAAALGLNATQVSLAGGGYPDLVFEQNIAEASAVVPLVSRRSLRLIYRFEDAKISDWHYDGVSVNPMPANNGAYLDFGPQKYKAHLFGASFSDGLLHSARLLPRRSGKASAWLGAPLSVPPSTV